MIDYVEKQNKFKNDPGSFIKIENSLKLCNIFESNVCQINVQKNLYSFIIIIMVIFKCYPTNIINAKYCV